MSLSNLLNHTITQYGPALESPGDSHVTQTLDVQLPPEGADLETPAHGIYYLVATASPLYRTRASYVNISNETAPIIFENPIGTAFGEFGSGIYIYRKSLGSTLPDGIEEVRIYDSLGSDFLSCENQVIFQVLLDEGFVMPDGPLTLKIDINGSAYPCPSGLVGEGGEGTTVGCNEAQNCGLGWFLRNAPIITTNCNSGDPAGPVVSIAKYCEDEYNSKNNPYNLCYQGTENNVLSPTCATSFFAINPLIMENIGFSFTSNVYDQDDISIQPCLGNSKPTCYIDADNSILENKNFIGLTEEQTLTVTLSDGSQGLAYPNQLSSVKGRILVPPLPPGPGTLGFTNGYFYPNFCYDHPDQENSSINWSGGVYDEAGNVSLDGLNQLLLDPDASSITEYLGSFNTSMHTDINTCSIDHSYLVLRGVDNISSPNYSSTSTIYPGGNIIPDKECWYININGCSIENLQLLADPQFVDVWSAITIQERFGGIDLLPNTSDYRSFVAFANSEITANHQFLTGGIDETQWTYFEYTETDNQCDFDLSGTTLEQIDNHTVKVCVPYRSDLVYARSSYHSVEGVSYSCNTDVRVNKIFINVYPVE